MREELSVAVSRLYLGCISAVSRRCISAVSRAKESRQLGRRDEQPEEALVGRPEARRGRGGQAGRARAELRGEVEPAHASDCV